MQLACLCEAGLGSSTEMTKYCGYYSRAFDTKQPPIHRYGMTYVRHGVFVVESNGLHGLSKKLHPEAAIVLLSSVRFFIVVLKFDRFCEEVPIPDENPECTMGYR